MRRFSDAPSLLSCERADLRPQVSSGSRFEFRFKDSRYKRTLRLALKFQHCSKKFKCTLSRQAGKLEVYSDFGNICTNVLFCLFVFFGANLTPNLKLKLFRSMFILIGKFNLIIHHFRPLMRPTPGLCL